MKGFYSVKSALIHIFYYKRTEMRVLNIVCLSAYAAAKTIPKDGALTINLEKAPSKTPNSDKNAKKSKKSKKKNGTPVVTLHAAPKPEYPQGEISEANTGMFVDPVELDTSFGQFAKKMQHPAFLNSENMLREMIEKGKSKI